MNPFSLFSSTWEDYKRYPSLRTSDATEDFIEGIDAPLKESKLFDVDDDVKKLLLLTKPSKNKEKLPFPSIFINVQLDEEETGTERIIGLLIREGQLLNVKNGEEVSKTIRISTLRYNTEEAWFTTFNPFGDGNSLINEEGKYEVIKRGLKKKTERTLRDFVYNFLDFINSPDVQVVEIERGEKNSKRRLRNGKDPLPSSRKIVLSGKIKEYLNQLHSSGQIRYSHRFWVRGHWRTLRNTQRYKENAGKKLWVLPYVKGKGILIEKEYALEKKGE